MDPDKVALSERYLGRTALERKALADPGPAAGRALYPRDLPAARRSAPVPSLALPAGQARGANHRSATERGPRRAAGMRGAQTGGGAQARRRTAQDLQAGHPQVPIRCVSAAPPRTRSIRLLFGCALNAAKV